MATAHVVDGETTHLSAGHLNFLLKCPVPRAQAQWARVHYTGSAWQVHPHTGAAGLTGLDLIWNVAQGQLEITLNDFEFPPMVMAQAAADDAALWPKAHAPRADQAIVRFYDNAGAHVSTLSIGMDVSVLLIGV